MELVPGRAVNVLEAEVDHEPLPADEVISGSPATATVDLGAFGGVQIGVWEMTPGAATDVEDDEVFLVVAGRARIEFSGDELPPLDIGPGDLVRLTAGMRTTWTVTETLRKVWIG